MTPDAPLIDLAALRGRYDGFLLDAYGVLVDGERALPGAAALLDDFERDGCPWLVVTNAASRLPETLSQGFAAVGLAIPPDLGAAVACGVIHSVCQGRITRPPGVGAYHARFRLESAPAPRSGARLHRKPVDRTVPSAESRR